MAVGTGEDTLDFGPAPGSTHASRAISRTSILAGSHVEAYLYPRDTADHSIDEHVVDGPHVFACAVVAGVGFTVYGVPRMGRLTGAWTFRWVSTD
jgi:hypothetical protein